MLFGRTPHDDRSDALSFFIGRVKYPQVPVRAMNTTIDPWDKYFSKGTKLTGKYFKLRLSFKCAII